MFTLFDFVGVTDHHGDDDSLAEGGLVMERPRRPRSEPRRLLALDVDDHIDPATRAWITLDEDGNMVLPEATERRRAAVGARFEAWLLAREDGLTAEQQRWLLTMGSQLRQNADVWDEFTPNHFAFAPFTLMGGLPEALRVFGGDARLDELLESLNAAVFKDDHEDPADGVPSQPAALR